MAQKKQVLEKLRIQKKDYPCIPVAIQRSPQEKELTDLQQQYFPAVGHLDLKYWKGAVLDKVIGDRKPGSVVLLFGERNRKYKGCVTLEEIYRECQIEDGFLYC